MASFSSAFRRCSCVDCGFAISEQSVSWPTCQPLTRQRLKTPETSQAPGARSKQAFELNGGTGTHIDAPAHFVVGGRTVDQLDTSELVNVPVCIIDCQEMVDSNADYLLSRDVILADEERHGPIPPKSLICIRTGWADKRYEKRDLYYNSTDDIDAVIKRGGCPEMHFPGISGDAAELLVIERQALGIGIDTLSPDGGSGGLRGYPAHHTVLGQDRYILENLHLRPNLPARGATAVVAPLNIVGAPESPVRVLLMLPEAD